MAKKRASRVKITDPTADREFDGVSGQNFSQAVDPGEKKIADVKVLDAQGEIASEPGKKRAELVELLTNGIQSSIMQTLSGNVLFGKIDTVSNSLYSMQKYGTLLKSAINTILTDFPKGDMTDSLMSEIGELCDVLNEGITRANAHLAEVSTFAENLKSIQNEIYHRMQTIVLES